jgi:hypothetical protein
VKIRPPAIDFESEALVRAVGRDDPTGDRFLEALEAGVDWPRLVDLSQRHRLMPQFCARLQSLGSRNPAPQDIMAWLKTRRRLNEGKNLILLGKLAEILDIFSRNRIEAIVLKGPVLAAAAYGSLAMRQFDDLDILIRPRDYARAKSLLTDMGFRPNEDGTPAQEAKYFRRNYGSEFIDARGRILVEMYARLTDTFRAAGLETENVFARKESLTVEGLRLPSLCAADSLIFLCFHGTRHTWPLLGMISDLAAFVASRHDWPWGEILEKAREAGLRRNLSLGLMLARDAAGLELPAEVETEAEDDAVAAKLEKQILADLFLSRTTEASYLEVALFNLKRRERLSDKVHFILRWPVLLSPMDWKTVRLPDGLFFLYIPLRFLRLIAMIIFPGLAKIMKQRLRNIRTSKN